MNVFLGMILTAYVYLGLISVVLIATMLSFGPARFVDCNFQWSQAINRFLISHRGQTAKA